jgi:type VI secretion system secreted protein VgrG
MSDGPNEEARAGNRADYVLGTREGWGAFKVVRWHGVEGLSTPLRFEVDVLRPQTEGGVNLDALIDTAATLRVATRPRWRCVHGIIAEAEELERTGTIILYRFVIVPHIWRATFRTRCRNFVDRTLQEILVTVLENMSPTHPTGHGGLRRLSGTPTAHEREPGFETFSEPDGLYRFAVVDDSRITDRTVYPYVAQYNETDFDFLSRLLEAEGLTYFFEHAEEGLVMTITDRPGHAPMFEEDESFELRPMAHSSQRNEEVIRGLRAPRRLQTSAVTMRDHDWRRHHIRLETRAHDGAGDPDILGHYEYPAGDEGVASRPTEYPARVALERFQTQRCLADGVSTVRRLEPGRRFSVKDTSGGRADAGYLAVRSETYAVELDVSGTVLDHIPFGFEGA